MGEMYAQKMDRNDPEYLIKQSVINSNNYLHDKTREDRYRLYAQIYFALSLVLTLMASFYIGNYKGIAIIILIDMLIIMLIISLYDYGTKRKRFWNNRKIMEQSFKDLGLEWRG